MKFFDWKYAGKAIISGITALIGALVLVVGVNEGIQDVTFYEWLGVALFVLASYGFTYNAPANTGGQVSGRDGNPAA